LSSPDGCVTETIVPVTAGRDSLAVREARAFCGTWVVLAGKVCRVNESGTEERNGQGQALQVRTGSLRNAVCTEIFMMYVNWVMRNLARREHETLYVLQREKLGNEKGAKCDFAEKVFTSRVAQNRQHRFGGVA